MTAARSTRPRIVSKPALPLPMIMAARAESSPGRRRRPAAVRVPRRLRRCGDALGPSAPSPPRKKIRSTPARFAALARDCLRCDAILLLEVARAERVDEVVDDIRTFQGLAATPSPVAASATTTGRRARHARVRENDVSSCSASRVDERLADDAVVARKTVTFTSPGSPAGAPSSGP